MPRQSAFLACVFIALLYGADKPKEGGFITILEYGKELYNNPRNISCVKCHGWKGQEQIITRYTTAADQERVFKAPPIYGLSFEQLKDALERGKSIMPRYNLTPDEIKAIYYYLRSTKQN
ncbi:hypothetical protein NHP190002_04760 [Helicobacter ailurogastricus]|uniref:Cytochrome c domain-containing protein n=1 Tax=Helicobacter ailurogastricus TaxID=1578720 RepID=A0A0K2XYJ8_9HELI|nr:hypothetical protein ASB7_11370 [Helicobacter ailurogastricus]GMB89797.1 hypothetical protein NHP190002_04760 [Helicobacter ailurogastricus]CRF52181.1 hypothetical protein HAL07_03070 [Helicobacter ailurogastricus]